MNSFNIKRLANIYIILFVAGLFSSLVQASETSDAAVKQLQTRWAQVNYELQDKAQQKAFLQLLDDVDKALAQYGGDAPVLIWSGIIKSSYAGAKGGLGALKYAKASKADLEKAMGLDGTALNGSAYTSLGTLYFKVPGWPLGFGDDEKAEKLLNKALQINPDGIDPNYFYAELLRENGDYAKAEKHLLKAQQAQARPERPLADKGRQAEISIALAAVQKKIK
ncbi:MAG: hypothetical protein KUG71_11325 [Porticoccaceae bacterium]|nr:hypothetical protein [Porticoccaceae bacterium]